MKKKEVKQALKPLLGVEPQYIWRYNRCQELARAIHEYFEAKMEPPKGWIDELARLWTTNKWDSEQVEDKGNTHEDYIRGQY